MLRWVRILAIIFAVAAVVFLILGVLYNPSFQNLFHQAPMPKLMIGMQQQFDLPSKILPPPTVSPEGGQILAYFGEAICNVTCGNFVVGNPAWVGIEIKMPNAVICKIYTIEVDPANAMMYMPPLLGENPPAWKSQIFLYPMGNLSWVGNQWVVFEASGMVNLAIKIFYEYPIGSSITETYVTSATIPNISIGTGQEAQQQASADMNLSLTFVVLFFAAVDIAVVLYDHSESKRETSDNSRHPFIVTS